MPHSYTLLIPCTASTFFMHCSFFTYVLFPSSSCLAPIFVMLCFHAFLKPCHTLTFLSWSYLLHILMHLRHVTRPPPPYLMPCSNLPDELVLPSSCPATDLLMPAVTFLMLCSPFLNALLHPNALLPFPLPHALLSPSQCPAAAFVIVCSHLSNALLPNYLYIPCFHLPYNLLLFPHTVLFFIHNKAPMRARPLSYPALQTKI